VKTESDGVEKVLDQFELDCGFPIYTVKPKHEGKGSRGKPDRIWTVRGFTIGIEAKRIMSKGDESTLPTAYQTAELRDIKKAGGGACVVDINSVDLFLELISRCQSHMMDMNELLETDDYKNTFDIENWAVEMEEITL